MSVHPGFSPVELEQLFQAFDPRASSTHSTHWQAGGSEPANHEIYQAFPQARGCWMTREAFRDYMASSGDHTPRIEPEDISSVHLPAPNVDYLTESIFSVFAQPSCSLDSAAEPQSPLTGNQLLSFHSFVDLHHLFFNDDTQMELIYWLFLVSLPRHVSQQLLWGAPGRKDVWYTLHHTLPRTLPLTVARTADHMDILEQPRYTCMDTLSVVTPVMDCLNAFFPNEHADDEKGLGAEALLGAVSSPDDVSAMWTTFLPKLLATCWFWSSHGKVFTDMLGGRSAAADQSEAEALASEATCSFLHLSRESQMVLTKDFLKISSQRDRVTADELHAFARQRGLEQFVTLPLCRRLVQCYASRRHPSSISFQDLTEVMGVVSSRSPDRVVRLLYDLADPMGTNDVTVRTALGLAREIHAALGLTKDQAEFIVAAVFLQATLDKGLVWNSQDNPCLSTGFKVEEIRDAVTQWGFWCHFLDTITTVLGADVGSPRWIDQLTQHQPDLSHTPDDVDQADVTAINHYTEDDAEHAVVTRTPSLPSGDCKHADDDMHFQDPYVAWSPSMRNGWDVSDAVVDDCTLDPLATEHCSRTLPPTPPDIGDPAPCCPPKTTAAVSPVQVKVLPVEENTLPPSKPANVVLKRAKSLRALAHAQQFRWTCSKVLMAVTIMMLTAPDLVMQISPSGLGSVLAEGWGLQQSMLGLLGSAYISGYSAQLTTLPFIIKSRGMRWCLLALSGMKLVSMFLGQLAVFLRDPWVLIVSHFVGGLGDFYLPMSLLLSALVPPSSFALVFGIANSIYMATMSATSFLLPVVADAHGADGAVLMVNYSAAAAVLCVAIYMTVWGVGGNGSTSSSPDEDSEPRTAPVPAGLHHVVHKAVPLKWHTGQERRCPSLLSAFSFPWRAQLVILYGLFNSGVIFSLFLFVPVFLVEQRGWAVGSAVAAISGTANLTAMGLVPLVGYLLDKHGRRFSSASVSSALLLVCFVVLAADLVDQAPWALGVMLGVHFSVVRGVGVPALNIILPQDRLRDASGTYLFLFASSIAVWVSVGGALYSSYGFSAVSVLLGSTMALSGLFMIAGAAFDHSDGASVMEAPVAAEVWSVSLRALPKLPLVPRQRPRSSPELV